MPESITKPAWKERTRGGLLVRYNYSTREVQHEQSETNVTFHQYDEVLVHKHVKYPELVSAIIRKKYPEDHELAMINNVLKDNTDADDINEYSEFQNYRDSAKIVAKAVTKGLSELEWNKLRTFAATLGLSASGTREEIEAAIMGML